MERDKALTQEEQNERTKFNAFQCIYVVCGLLYGGFWLKRDSFFAFLPAEDSVFFLTSAAMLLLTPLILGYNHQYEAHAANKRGCLCIALFVIGTFAYQLIKIVQ